MTNESEIGGTHELPHDLQQDLQRSDLHRDDPREEVHRAQREELASGVVGLFEAPHAANRAFDALLRLGYQPGEVGILIAEETKQRFFQPSPLTHPAEPDQPGLVVDEEHGSAAPQKPPEEQTMLAGAGAMSAVGALSGVLIAASAAVVAPGLGLLLLGPLAGMGAGFGALVGGVYAVPTVEMEQGHLVELYEKEVKAGKVLIHVVPHTEEDEARIREEWARIKADAG